MTPGESNPGPAKTRANHLGFSLFIPAFFSVSLCLCVDGLADPVIPHAQDKPPGPALSPDEAVKQMKVPEGFVVELVASEPMLVNPIAMCFDERGRIWVTESLEYPRNEPGVGRDRIKILEDIDGDGKADKATIFAEGLNIPSGIAVGHGGVWVSNPPDILFMQDTDGDGKADKREVVVTGFGRQDTHEMANSLTWGPDGYLYGQNGVFVHNVIEQNGRKFDFTGAIWRINPRTREFEIFAQGLSNPWGITFNENGEMFVSACVIDHLWHITQTGYYIRQAGAYPAHTWPIGSIVDHKHQKAAYCGIVWFDSDAYPPEFREKLYMGNIHGNCINTDALERNGSTYRGKGLPDLMSSGGDVWFMPVAQKVGPDGNLYILDWYDRYHCYQDARRDPVGIDRLKGRLYRLRYEGDAKSKPLPRPLPKSEGSLDLGKLPDDELIVKLGDANVFIRETAQRLLNERNNTDTRAKLQAAVLNASAPRKQRMHAMWALISTGQLDKDFHLRLLKHEDATFRAWAVRAAGNFGATDQELSLQIASMHGDPSSDVLLQLAVTAGRANPQNPSVALHAALAGGTEDPLIPHVVWKNLQPHLDKSIEKDGVDITALVGLSDRGAGAMNVARRAVDFILAHERTGEKVYAELVESVFALKQSDLADHTLRQMISQTLTGQLSGPRLEMVKASVGPRMTRALDSEYGRTSNTPALLAAAWGDVGGLQVARSLAQSANASEQDKLTAIQCLAFVNDSQTLDLAAAQIQSASAGGDYRRAVVASLGRLNNEQLAPKLLSIYGSVEPAVQSAVIELLIQRPITAGPLLAAIEKKDVSRDVVNLNQVRGLAASPDEAVRKKVEAIWGRVRTDRNPNREKVIADTHRLASRMPGDAVKGAEVFTRTCAVCHVIHGQGQNMGPDLTGNGRSTFEQLLSNVLDPNLVVGEAYQLRTVTMKDGRVLAGMVAEQNEQRIVLKMIGGQSETLPAAQVQQVATLPVSFMPEGLENSMTQQELVDLLAYLSLDKPPTDPQARRIPGTPTPR